MANDFFIRYEDDLPETPEESLTRQFYEWERRGRGWQVFDVPVEIEPPFRPFYLFDASATRMIDDGRHPTFFSNLIENWRGSPSAGAVSEDNRLAEYQSFIAEADEPLFCQYYSEEFTEFRLVLPKDLKVTKPVAKQLLLSFSYCSNPVSFEVIGNSERIIIQFAATRKDALQVRQQIKSHLPESSIVETTGYLEEAWLSGGVCGVIADFGLSNEFMLPLQAVSNFDTDLLVSIVGALSKLEQGEVGVFQVLFQRAKAAWAEEIINSVRFFDGTPFFSNAPEIIPLTKEKVSSPLFATIIRVAARSSNEQRMWQIAKSLGAGLSALSNPIGNELIPLSGDGYYQGHHMQSLLNRQSFRCGMILNSEELVSIVHAPSSNVRTEKFIRESEKTKPAPALALGHSLILGENIHQGETKRISLSDEQRTRHLHLIGSSGSGKSTLLLNLIKQDLERWEGLCVIDPHGDLIDEVISNVPESRLSDVVLFDPSDSELPIGFNILQANSELEKTILASDLIATFRRMSTSWGDVMDSVLANAVLAFVESTRGGTLFELKRFLVEKNFRAEFLESVEDDAICYFWQNEFPLIAGKPQSSILIRLDAFLRQRLIRNVVCQRQNKINFREIMDTRKILLIKLSQGLIGEENAYLLGTLLVSKLYQTALSRQDTSNRPHFWLYMDEFHHFITPSMESVLSGVRKYNLGLVLAHQEFRQLQSRSQEVASSVLSNCYTRICFRLGDADAERFAGGFSFFDGKALQNLGVGEAIARIERAEYDFNLKTSLLPKVDKELAGQRKDNIVGITRARYATQRAEVEEKLRVPQPSETVTASASKAEKSESSGVNVPQAKEKAENNILDLSPVFTREENPAALTANVSLSQKDAVSDKGSQQHRYLQSLVKRMAESHGFLVTIEKEVFGGAGRIDVALENETAKIACEISVTNAPEYEIQNVRKCLSANFSPVIVISADLRHLDKIRRLAEENLSEDDFSKAKFFTPEEFHSWIESLETEPTGQEEKVKGFRVNVKLKSIDEAGRSTRKKAISDVVFGALKKLKKDDEDK